MGSSASMKKPTTGESRTKEIDRRLEREMNDDENKMKLLLLGISGSGKSTIAKQMKIIHCGGFSEEEKHMYRNLVYFTILEAFANFDENILNSIDQDPDTSVLSLNMSCSPTVDSQAQSSARKSSLRRIRSLHASVTEVDILKRHLKRAHHTAKQQNVLSSLQRYNSPDSVILQYFVPALDSLLEDDYVPSELDILVTRIPTTGITEINFEREDHQFSIIDVGGQRSERRKWLHCFDLVKTIIFVVDLNSFDEESQDDDVDTKLEESVKVFSQISQHPSFSGTPIILFLNKVDLFKEKLQSVSLHKYCPEYDGDNNFDSAVRFIKLKFQSTYYRANSGTLYCFCTTATDTANIDKVFSATVDIMFNKSLKDAGLW